MHHNEMEKVNHYRWIFSVWTIVALLLTSCYSSSSKHNNEDDKSAGTTGAAERGENEDNEKPLEQDAELNSGNNTIDDISETDDDVPPCAPNCPDLEWSVG